MLLHFINYVPGLAFWLGACCASSWCRRAFSASQVNHHSLHWLCDPLPRDVAHASWECRHCLDLPVISNHKYIFFLLDVWLCIFLSGLKNNVFCAFRAKLCWTTSSVADAGCLSRIPDPDFYPSRISDPRPRIPDPGTRIPDPKTSTKERDEITINVPLFKKLRDIIFFFGTITLWAISRDILRGPRLFWPLKLSWAQRGTI